MPLLLCIKGQDVLSSDFFLLIENTQPFKAFPVKQR